MTISLRPVVVASGVVGLAIGIVGGLLVVTRGTSSTESATDVLRKSEARQARLLDTLGPNMTYHTITSQHRDQRPDQANTDEFATPDDTVTELFMTFGKDGMLETFTQVSRGPDGVVFQRGELGADNVFSFTDEKTGATFPAFTYPRFPASALAERLAEATTKAIEATAPSAQAESATVDGVAAFVIETASNRTYVSKDDYRALRSEQLTNGVVTEYTVYEVQEVLAAAPPASTTTPAESTPGAPAALTIAVGAPSLVGGEVHVPITVSGDAASAYAGYNVHVRWDPKVFSFLPTKEATNSVLAAPYCPAPILDSDGGGATYSCIAIGEPTKATGLLTTVVLSPQAESGCSKLHLFTFGAPDGGDATTGTYTIDATTSGPQPVLYADGSASVKGERC